MDEGSHSTVQTNQSQEAPGNTAFSQQRIVAWRPLFTPNCTSIMLLVLGSVLIITGSLLYVYLSNLSMIDIRYDDVCQGKSVCGIVFNVKETIKGNIYLHYKLTNFYQNHVRYLFSRNDAQLRGEYVTYDNLADCGDFRSINNSNKPENLLIPSGAIALSLFNDTYEWINTSIANFSEAGISWRSDRDKLFRRASPEYMQGVKWLDALPDFPGGQRNEHFIVWMRTAALPTFLKVYARCINCEIPPGDYKLMIENNYPTNLFSGEKHIVLSQVNMFGGRNPYIGTIYISVGIILFVFGIVILLSNIFFPRTLGDTSFLRKL